MGKLMQDMATLPPEMTRSVIADESHAISAQLTKYYYEDDKKDMLPDAPWSQGNLSEDNLDPPLFKKKDLKVINDYHTESLVHACVSC